MAAIVHELFRFGFYKRNQGRYARLATFWAIGLIVALGAWSLNRYLVGFIGEDWTPLQQSVARYFIPLAVLAAGFWASFRIVQMPTFADFLISVEGEMNKVSWPSRGELFRASLVVILVIFFLAGILFAYDAILKYALEFFDRVIESIFG